MYKKLLLMITLISSHLLCAELKQDSSAHIQFKREKLPFGFERQKMSFVNNNGESKYIGSIAILSSKQFSVFDSPIFTNIDKNTFAPEVVELINLIPNVKNELTTSLEQVVLLGDLYVHPKYRGHGYAKLLMQKTCQEIFSTTQANFIVLVPEPFEYENNMQKSLRGTLEYEEKKDRLVKLYKSMDFIPCQRDVFFMYLKRK